MATSKVFVYNGSQWVPHYDIRRHNGTSWQPFDGVYRWNSAQGAWRDQVVPRQRYTKQWKSTWIRSYDHNRNRISTTVAMQGPDSRGNLRYGMVGFDWDDIQNELAGATLINTRLLFQVSHTTDPRGAIAVAGLHNEASAPAQWTTTVGRLYQSAQVPQGLRVIEGVTEIARAFRAKEAKGVVFYNTSGSMLYTMTMTSATLEFTYEV